jgi:hypothetical protein
LSTALAVGGGLAAVRVLERRHRWEAANRAVAVCLDFDDAYEAAVRAGLPFDELLARVAAAGATHVSLPELTLNRLRCSGRLTSDPSTTRPAGPRVGTWSVLRGGSDAVAHVQRELVARFDWIEAETTSDTRLDVSGDLVALGDVGLGFDGRYAERIGAHGLGVVPRPVSYPWPERRSLDRSLAQAATIGPLVAFDGDMILGHEMHLEETLAALEREDLTFVYFAESRHQKGDWFIAKERAPHVLLAHGLSPSDMVPLDYHAACESWVHLARERGIRFCYVNFFRVLHATEPLEGLQYLGELCRSLRRAGFRVEPNASPPHPIPTPDASELAVMGLASAGIASSAVSTLFDIPERVSILVTAAAACGAMALPFLEEEGLLTAGDHSHDHVDAHGRTHDHGHAHAHDHEHDHAHDHVHDHDHTHAHAHDHDHAHDHGHDHGHSHATFATSYAPKLVALATTACAPIAVSGLAGPRGAIGFRGFDDWCGGVLSQAAGCAVLAAVTSGQDYHLRIEEYRGFDLDWLLPALAVGLTVRSPGLRTALVGAVGLTWLVLPARAEDVLASIDAPYPQGHTHHISAAQRTIGDVRIALGVRPARKWAGLAPFGYALSRVLVRWGAQDAARAATVAGMFGSAAGLVGFRRAERSLEVTARVAAPSFAMGVVGGLAAWIVSLATPPAGPTSKAASERVRTPGVTGVTG